MIRARGRSGGIAWSALFALLLLIPSPASAAIALVQDVFVQSPAGTNETIRTATFSSNVTAGNAVIATITGSTGASLTSLSGGGVTWTQAVTQQVGSAQRVWIYYGTNSSGGTKTVTLEGTAGKWTLQVAEFSGIDNSAPLDGTASATGTSAFPPSGNVTVTSPGALLIAVESDSTGLSANVSTGDGFTILQGGATSFGQALYTNQSHNPAYRITPSTGVHREQWANNTSTAVYGAAIAAFKSLDDTEIGYRGNGGYATTVANPSSCGIPAGTEANDVALWHTLSRDNLAHTYPLGWTKVTQVNEGTGLTHSWAWKRLAAGESGNLTVTVGGTAAKACRILVFRGVRASGDPYEAATTAQATTNTVDPAAVSINNVGALIVALMGIGDDNTVAGGYGGTVGLNYYGTAVGSPWQVFDFTTTLGSDLNLAWAYARATSTGPFPTSVDFGWRGMAASDPWITFTVALVPGCPVVSDPSYVVANARSGQTTVYWSSSNPVVILRKA
ncbi:MAG TPA: hypothetical protein VGQ18_00015, partial [Gemmatimonadales bacterium]|nr:hypothetical protein [Gemmatimonadales bacterium]